MKKEVSQEEIQSIKIHMKLDPGAFWSYTRPWCMLSYWPEKAEWPKCSRAFGHKGLHVAALQISSKVILFPNTKPWYGDE